MSDLELPPNPAPSLASKFGRFQQWTVFVLVLLFALTNLIHLEHTGLPGFPQAGFWIMLATGFLLALWHLPRIYFELPRRWQIAAYIAILPALAMTVYVGSQAFEAFHRTPEGMAAKAKQDVADAQSAKEEAERAESKRILETAAITQAKLADYQERLEGCFSTFGHRLSSLESEVKDTLHNPGAFEHIETVAIVTDTQGNNVGMRFRAENGFGALRAANVKARIDVGDCSVVSIGEPVVGD